MFRTLPPGSIRAILAILIVGMFWLLMLMPTEKFQAIPLHLYLLLGLVGLFFFAHGRSIAMRSDPEPSPLGLPGGVIRFLLIGGTVAVGAYLHFVREVNIAAQLTPDTEEVRKYWAYYMFAVVGGLVGGSLLRSLPFQRSNAFRAFQAWVSVIAMLLLVAEVIVEVAIKPSLGEDIGDIGIWRTVLTAVVATYYGIRS